MPSADMPKPASSDAAVLRTAFAGGRQTLGIEEELMLLDPETLDLAPVAADLLHALHGDTRFKGELPAAQIELITEPADTVALAGEAVRAARHRLARSCAGVALPAGAGMHPFAAGEGELSDDPKYAFARREYGPMAARQLVFGLHVHVRVPGAERALGVYNALRSYLPTLGALVANAPFYEGCPSGLASTRPKLSELLPRQGIPPKFDTMEELAAAHAFGRASGTFDAGAWWWELRLHPVHGTVEVRVADQPSTVADTVAVAAVTHSLVAALAQRLDSGESLPCHPTWAIAENRWLAARHGLAGDLLDLDTGERRNARELVRALIDSLRPVARDLRCETELEAAMRLSGRNGSERQLAAGDAHAAARELVALFLD